MAEPARARPATGGARRPEVCASTAGPYAKYGDELVAACAREGTAYCDISGEAKWIGNMERLHDATARASGATLVPGSGFDSVPSDLGTLLAVRHFEAARGEAPERVDCYVTEVGGGACGMACRDDAARRVT